MTNQTPESVIAEVIEYHGAPEPEWEYGSAHRDDPSVGATEYSKERAEQRVREWNDHDDQKGGLLVRRRKAGPWLPVDGESK